ncbi:MAG: hypothetical protein APR63_14065 [Desulfuromonas sp. SDB]|nr:MAG: hypothetical protein APR63_14065 [Desulfuromonas sp. SDB]
MKIYHLLVNSGVMLSWLPLSLFTDTLWQQIPLDIPNCTGYACQENSSYPFIAKIDDDIVLSYETWFIFYNFLVA